MRGRALVLVIILVAALYFKCNFYFTPIFIIGYFTYKQIQFTKKNKVWFSLRTFYSFLITMGIPAVLLTLLLKVYLAKEPDSDSREVLAFLNGILVMTMYFYYYISIPIIMGLTHLITMSVHKYNLKKNKNLPMQQG